MDSSNGLSRVVIGGVDISQPIIAVLLPSADSPAGAAHLESLRSLLCPLGTLAGGAGAQLSGYYNSGLDCDLFSS